MSRIVPTALALGVIAAGGFWLSGPAGSVTSEGPTLPSPTKAPPPLAPEVSASVERSPLAALRLRLGSAPSPEETMRALAETARSDPALALDLAQSLGQTDEEKAMWVTDLARQWATRDPEQAWSWLQGQHPARIRALASGALPETIVGAIAKAQPALLVAQLDTLLAAGEGSLGISPVVAIHLGMDALAAAGQLALARATVERWAADPAQPAIGEAAFVSIAAALAQSDALQAGAWLQSLPASASRDLALTEFPAQLAQRHSPRTALDWAEANLTAELRSQALQRTFSDWVESAPADAGDWLGHHLARHPGGDSSDRLISTLVNLGPAVKANPVLALQWAALVSDPLTRASLEERVALHWARLDAAAAASFIANHSTFSPARKQALLLQAQSPQHLASEG